MTTTGTLERHPATSLGAASRRSARSQRARRRAVPYLLLLPAVVVYGVFTVYPVFRQFELGFFNWHIFPGASNPFVGLSNYTQLFHDPIVRTAAFNSFLFIVVTVPLQMAIGMFAAAVLTDRLPGSVLWRAAVYIPVVTSWVVVSWVFSYIFSSQGGVANALVGFFAGHTVSIDWTAKTWTANAVIWLLSIWKGMGWSFIIFLAALDGVPRELMEAARIDGASERRVWRHVVIPSLRTAITFVLVLLVIGGGTGLHPDLRGHQRWPLQLDTDVHDLPPPAGLHQLPVRLRCRPGVASCHCPLRLQLGRDTSPAPAGPLRRSRGQQARSGKRPTGDIAARAVRHP